MEWNEASLRYKLIILLIQSQEENSGNKMLERISLLMINHFAMPTIGYKHLLNQNK